MYMYGTCRGHACNCDNTVFILKTPQNGSPSGPLHVKDCSTTHHVLIRQASVYSLPAVKEKLEPEEGAEEERREEKKWEHEGGDSDDVFYSETTISSVARKCTGQKVEGMVRVYSAPEQESQILIKNFLSSKTV